MFRPMCLATGLAVFAVVAMIPAVHAQTTPTPGYGVYPPQPPAAYAPMYAAYPQAYAAAMSANPYYTAPAAGDCGEVGCGGAAGGQTAACCDDPKCPHCSGSVYGYAGERRGKAAGPRKPSGPQHRSRKSVSEEETFPDCQGHGWVPFGYPPPHGGPGAHYSTPYAGPSGPPTGAYAYPYYSLRGPRDFFLNDPASIGY